MPGWNRCWEWLYPTGEYSRRSDSVLENWLLWIRLVVLSLVIQSSPFDAKKRNSVTNCATFQKDRPRWTVCFPFVLEPASGRWVPDQKVLPCPSAGYRIPPNTTAPIQGNVGSRRVEHHVNSRVKIKFSTTVLYWQIFIYSGQLLLKISDAVQGPNLRFCLT